MRRVHKFRLLRHRWFIRREVFTVLLLFGVLAGFFLLLSATKQLQVVSVQCTTSLSQQCPADVDAELRKLIGRPVYNMQLQPMREKLIQAVPAIKAISFRLRATRVIEAVVELQTPAYIVQIASPSASLLISANGLSMGEASPEVLQELRPYGVFELVNGMVPIAPKMHMALLTTQQELIKRSLAVEKIMVFDPDQIELHLAGEKIAVITGSEAAKQLSALQQLLNTATIIEQGARRIDVRFTHPVLR